ncbi:MAG: hypothetical protein LC647_11120 [Beggiatoa sp.]|nr:hypothetical protein [Beggiatoa sp.]
MVRFVCALRDSPKVTILIIVYMNASLKARTTQRPGALSPRVRLVELGHRRDQAQAETAKCGVTGIQAYEALQHPDPIPGSAVPDLQARLSAGERHAKADPPAFRVYLMALSMRFAELWASNWRLLGAR